jgi:type I restriction enzyme S subunit
VKESDLSSISWEQRKLGDLLQTLPFKQFLKEPEPDGKYEIIQQGNEPVIGFANGTPCGDYKDVVIFGDHTLSLYKPQHPFFVATDGVRIVKGQQDTDGYYLLSLLERYKPQSEGYKRYYSILADTNCNTTYNTSEQEKIGAFFKLLDSLITLHQSKSDSWKNKKNQLSTISWEQRKLGDMAIFNPKADLPDVFEYVDLESVVGTEMLTHRTELKRTAPSRAQRLAQTGDLFYQTVRPYQKNNYLFEKPDKHYVFSTGYAQMRPFDDGRFLLCLVQNDSFVKDVLDNCTGTSYPAINSFDLEKIEVYSPSNPQEQKRIGDFFKDLDSLITLHQRMKNLLVNQ